MTGYVYMTASQKGGTIYIGVTNDLGQVILDSPPPPPFADKVKQALGL